MKTVAIAVASALLAGAGWDLQEPGPEAPKPAEFFTVEKLVAQAKKESRAYLSFLERSTMSVGLYRLPAGGKDGQSPHDRDEVYYVVEGEATFRAAGEETVAKPGAVLFVAAGVEHRFVDVKKDLVLVVFFSNAPAEEKETED